MGTYASLGDVKLVNHRSTGKKPATPRTWQTETGAFKYDKEVAMTNMRIPLIIINRRVDTKFHLFEKVRVTAIALFWAKRCVKISDWIYSTARDTSLRE